MRVIFAFLIGLFLGGSVALVTAQSGVLRTSTSGLVKLSVADVAALPTCDVGTKGTVMMAGDSLTPVALATVIGGGGVAVIVGCNGANWIVF